MNDNLTPGMIAALEGYLAPYMPADEYNDETDMLISTGIIITTLDDAVDLEMNPVADYMAERGFKYYFVEKDCVDGWILRPKTRLIESE
jgi:hypothetical protein